MSFAPSTEESSSALHFDFHQLPPHVPTEIAVKILQHWIEPESVMVESTILNGSEVLFTSYASPTDALVPTLPSHLQAEYWRLRQLSWLQSTKVFRTPSDFYMSHWLLSLDPASRLPDFDTAPYSLTRTYPSNSVAIDGMLNHRHPHLPYHGLERIELDFDASQYFALFNVSLPPFDKIDTTVHGDERHHDKHLHGAASFLQHTRHLTLRFGKSYRWAHAWSGIMSHVWGDASRRPHVCESGLVIDWILEYAWAGEFLQHIDTVEIAGDVQPWVKAKWAAIFAEHASLKISGNADLFAAHKPDLHAIEFRGMSAGEELEWVPEEQFPPRCECEIRCWRLQDGGVLGEVEEWEGDVSVVGDWDGNCGGVGVWM